MYLKTVTSFYLRGNQKIYSVTYLLKSRFNTDSNNFIQLENFLVVCK